MAIIMRGITKYVIDRKSTLDHILIAYGYASREQIDEAKSIQESADVVGSSEDKSPGEGERVLGEILISLGHTTKNQIAEAIRNLNYYRVEDERKAVAAGSA